MYTANRSRFSGKRARAPGAWLLVVVGALAGVHGVTSCVDLPDLNEEGCGNGLINTGEDCDGNKTANNGSLACGAPGTAQQCRFTCSKDATDGGTSDGGAIDDALCPTGYRCGVDKICRAPSGYFDRVDQALLPHARAAMVLADADGDGRLDLFSQDAFFTSVDYFDDAGRSIRTLHFQAQMIPAVGDIARDGRADFTLSGDAKGLVVMRGQSDRSFLPTTSPLMSFAGASRAALTLPGALSDRGDLQVVIAKDAKMTMTTMSSSVGVNQAALTDSSIPGDTATSLGIAVGNLDKRDSSPYEEFVIARGSSGPFDVFALTDKGEPFSSGARSTVSLEGGLVVRSFFLANTDAGDDLDLVIAASKDPEATGKPLTAIYRALGDGKGGFAKPDVWTEAKLPPNAYRLLAVDDINVDGSPDLIVWTHQDDNDMGPISGTGGSPEGIWISHTGAKPLDPVQLLELPPSAPRPSSEMTQESLVNMEAKVVDLNGDKLPDVVVASDLQPGAFYFLNQGYPRFNPFQVFTESPPRHLTLGDFDGDAHLDLAFVEANTASAKFDTLAVAFGEANGTLAAAASMGQVGKTKWLVSGRALMPSTVTRTSSDIVAISESATDTEVVSKVTVFSASGDRQLLAPYIIPLDKRMMNMLPKRMSVYSSVIGHFDTTDESDVAAIVSGENAGSSFQLLLLHAKSVATDSAEVELTAGAALNLDKMSQGGSARYNWREARLLAWRQGMLDHLVAFVPLQGMGMGMGFASFVFKFDEAKSDEAGLRGGFTSYKGPTVIPGEALVSDAPPCLADLGAPARMPAGVDDLAILTQESGSPETARRHVRVFWGGIGALDAEHSEVVDLATVNAGERPCADDEKTTGFACIKASKPKFTPGGGSTSAVDAERELVILSDKAWYIAKYRDGGWKRENYDETCKSGGDAVGAGDVTGDGVDDLLIANHVTESTRVFSGKPVIR